MSPRTTFLIAVGLIILILGITWLSYSTRNQVPPQVFSAAFNRDCAPWDGAAFTVSVPLEDGTRLQISIWQSPDIQHPVTFSFPDETGQVGFAYIPTHPDNFQQLSGDVSFQRVEIGIPVEGEFDLTAESGERFHGMFTAEWGDQVVYCG